MSHSTHAHHWILIKRGRRLSNLPLDGISVDGMRSFLRDSRSPLPEEKPDQVFQAMRIGYRWRSATSEGCGVVKTRHTVLLKSGPHVNAAVPMCAQLENLMYCLRLTEKNTRSNDIRRRVSVQLRRPLPLHLTPRKGKRGLTCERHV